MAVRLNNNAVGLWNEGHLRGSGLGQGKQSANHQGLRELAGSSWEVWRQDWGTPCSGTGRVIRRFGWHRADKDWMTGMARAAVRMGTWRLDTQG